MGRVQRPRLDAVHVHAHATQIRYRWILLPRSQLLAALARGGIDVTAYADRLSPVAVSAGVDDLGGRVHAAPAADRRSTTASARPHHRSDGLPDDRSEALSDEARCARLCRALRGCAAYVWKGGGAVSKASQPLPSQRAPRTPDRVLGTGGMAAAADSLAQTCFLVGMSRQEESSMNASGVAGECPSRHDVPCNGLVGGDRRVCCDARCGTCGGRRCGARVGGRHACCTGRRSPSPTVTLVRQARAPPSP